MNLEERKQLCQHEELKAKARMAIHNNNLANAGVGICSTKIDFKCHLIESVAECYRKKKLSNFIKEETLNVG